MKRIKILSFVLVIAGIISSCKEESYQVYKDVARIQFGSTTTGDYLTVQNPKDTVRSYSFVYLPPVAPPAIGQDSVFLDAYVIGGPANYDRPFKIKQVKVEKPDSNAVEGIHFLSFSNPESEKNFVIKAGKVHVRFPIILLRDASLKTQKRSLKITFEENDHFKLGEVAYLWQKIEFADKVVKPDIWQINYFGTYSEVKHLFMIQKTGQKWDQEFMSLFTVPTLNYGLVTYYKGLLNKALNLYNSEHPSDPLKDELGNLVTFPS